MSALGRISSGRQDERGVSLAELLVTIMIFGIVLTVVTGTFVSLTRSTSRAGTTDSNVRAASNGMNEMTREIRGAVNNPVPNAADTPAFSEATTESLKVSTAVNLAGSTAQPQLVYLYLGSDRSLVEKKTGSVSFQSTYWQFTGAMTSRTLTGPVSPASATVPVLFQYFDSSGAKLTPDATGKLSTTQMGLIASVTISLTIKSTSVYDNGVLLINTVGLPNLAATGPVS